ncbi:MAG: hypothetical protein WAU82_13030 [Candidatus Binatus sp.]|uniref:hypothetical protein n=1 Tax=Candidatus Binatus sp. TaxID=2811406 RepID=UPI003BB0DFA9
MKSYPGFERHREAKSISRMLVASVVIAVATSAWGCSSRVDSSRVETFDDWDSSLYASFRYLYGNISDTSASVSYVDLADDSAVARSGYTDPSWEPAGPRSEGGEVSFPATNNRVLELPQALSWANTAAAIPMPGAGD